MMDENERLMWQAVRELGIDVPVLSWSVKPGVGGKPAEVTLRLMYGGVHVWKEKKPEVEKPDLEKVIAASQMLASSEMTTASATVAASTIQAASTMPKAHVAPAEPAARAEKRAKKP